jgi:hypothetical protein
MPRTIYPRERSGIHYTEESVVSRELWTGEDILAPTGVQPPNRPARSESLYRPRYPEGPNGWNEWFHTEEPQILGATIQTLVAGRHGALDVCTPGHVSLYHWINAKINFRSGSSPTARLLQPRVLATIDMASVLRYNSSSCDCQLLAYSPSHITGHFWLPDGPLLPNTIRIPSHSSRRKPYNLSINPVLNRKSIYQGQRHFLLQSCKPAHHWDWGLRQRKEIHKMLSGCSSRYWLYKINFPTS